MTVNDTLFSETPFKPDSIFEVAFLIAALDQEKNIYGSGTCISIGSNLVITAKHVIEDFFTKYGYEQKEKTITPNFGIWLIQPTNKPNSKNMIFAIWSCVNFWFCPYSDIAILQIQAHNDVAQNKKYLKPCIMTLSPPRVGEKVFGLGFKGDDLQSSITTVDELGTTHYKLNHKPYTTGGIVTGVYNEQSPTRSKSPCFETNLRLDGSMSGAPIFTEKGRLCGIASSTYPAFEKDEQHTTFICSLWPLMGTKIQTPRGAKYSDQEYYVLELAKSGFINALDWEKVTINPVKDEIYFKKF